MKHPSMIYHVACFRQMKNRHTQNVVIPHLPPSPNKSATVSLLLNLSLHDFAVDNMNRARILMNYQVGFFFLCKPHVPFEPNPTIIMIFQQLVHSLIYTYTRPHTHTLMYVQIQKSISSLDV